MNLNYNNPSYEIINPNVKKRARRHQNDRF